MKTPAKNTTKVTSLDHYGDLMTATDLSNFLGVSKNTVYNEIREGKFGEPIKFGREYRIPKIYIAQRYLVGYNYEHQKSS
jgi:excisionase family DNA binding protein